MFTGDLKNDYREAAALVGQTFVNILQFCSVPNYLMVYCELLPIPV